MKAASSCCNLWEAQLQPLLSFSSGLPMFVPLSVYEALKSSADGTSEAAALPLLQKLPVTQPRFMWLYFARQSGTLVWQLQTKLGCTRAQRSYKTCGYAGSKTAA